VFRFSSLEEGHFRLLLWSGRLDEDMDDLFRQFRELPPTFQFELIRYVKEKRVYPSAQPLMSALNLPEEEAGKLLRNEYVEFLVPVVEGGRGELVKALVVKGLDLPVTNQRHLLRSLEPVYRLVGEGFAFFVEKPLSGESFTLPLAVHLLAQNVPGDLLFTGRVDSEGRVYDVDGLPRKRRIAAERGYRLVEPFHFKSVQEIVSWLDAPAYEIPFYVTKTAGSYEGELRDFLSSVRIEDPEGTLSCLEVLSGFPRERLILTTGQLPPDPAVWEGVVAEFFRRLKSLETALRGREILHLAVNGPAVLAFALGAVFGSQKPFVFYHRQDSGYIPIEVRKVRRLKERLGEYRHIRWKLEEDRDELAVILSLAHHEPEASVKEFMKGRGTSFLTVEHERKGNIPVEDMFETARECASLIQDLRTRKSFRTFHIFLSSPIPIAFMVGVAFGYYSPGYIYHHQGEGMYFRAVDLSAIRAIREGKIPPSEPDAQTA